MVKKTNMQHPENFDDVNQIEATQPVIDFVKELAQDIEDEKAARGRWEIAVDRLQKLRYGVRKAKNHPWPKAANFMIPQIDTDINKAKPAYVNLVFGVSPIATFEPFGPEDVESAKNRELLFDWRMRTKVKFFMPFNYGLDHILGAQGQTVFRIIWKFTTRTYSEILDLEDLDEETVNAIFDPRLSDDDLTQGIIEEYTIDTSFEENLDEARKAVQMLRDGETRIVMELLEKSDDRPEVIACDVKEDLVVPTDTKHIQDARFIDYKFWIPVNDIKIAMRDGKYDKFSDRDVEKWANKSANTGVTVNKYQENRSDDMVLLHETCVWYDVDDDGIEERCIVTWPDADSGAILRFIENPYDHGLFPYVQVKRELTECGFYASRGYPSLEEDFQIGISTALNQAVDNGTIMNTPVVVARKGIISNPRNRRYIPGEVVETTGPTQEYETRQLGNASQGILFQQAQYLKSWADNRLGQLSASFSSMTDLAGTGDRGRKTKAEIEAVSSLQGQAQSLDLQVFQQQMADVYYQIDALYDQFGADEEVVLITNDRPVRMTRKEIQGKFNIVPNGRVDNATPAQRLQKLILAAQFGVNSQIVKQDELAKAIFEELDARYTRFIKTDEEIQTENESRIQAQEVAKAQALEEAVGVKLTMDDTDVLKEAKLMPITGKKFAPD